jgi:hypothetical protein
MLGKMGISVKMCRRHSRLSLLTDVEYTLVEMGKDSSRRTMDLNLSPGDKFAPFE